MLKLHLKHLIFPLVLVFLSLNNVHAEDLTDTLSSQQQEDKRFDFKNAIIPGVCLAYGLASLKIDALKDLNTSTNQEIKEHKPEHIIWDNFTQYTPAALVFGLNWAGVESKHNFRDRTLLYLSSQLIMTSIVYPIKLIAHEQRPDGSSYNSFPSGHTATAFSSAQFMFREYKDKNLWLSLSGYPIAAFTGVYRIINNRHWVGDVVAGAGIGILSTELAYWLYPKVNKLLGHRKQDTSVAVSPVFQSGNVGLAFVKSF